MMTLATVLPLKGSIATNFSWKILDTEGLDLKFKAGKCRKWAIQVEGKSAIFTFL